ncbi:membrane protein FxsA [Phyllobacterium phragmitis]|uniref:Membrane protein FxsA n=1 Tax=Phyllobacterium phragmitis TaxID=2670329 RepID=A0A2S9IVH0_9HYPH|nr:FxsA family protein [Phyllobacterium phragmitis]PRD44507.1 membrane protein FxsA [Phyllobacterium phragmitis]
MPSSLIPLLLLAMPFVEIAGFVIVGSHIGVLATLALVVLSAMLGFFLLRVQGFGLLQRIRAEAAAGRVPDRELVHGAMLVLAAILLIIPGFVSDIFGLLLFIPPLRDIVWRQLSRSGVIVTTGGTGSTRYGRGYDEGKKPSDRAPGNQGKNREGDRVIDLDPEDYSHKPDPNSPWRGDDNKE